MGRKKIRTPKAEASADEIAVYAHIYFRQDAEVKRQKRALDVIVKEMKTKHVSPKEIVKAFAEVEISAVERQAAATRAAAYLQAIGAPVQLEMFEMSMPKPNDTIARARERGRMDAIRGLSEMEISHNAGTPEGQAWLEGHRDLLDLVAQYYRRFEAPDDEPPPESFGAAATEVAADSGVEATDDLHNGIAETLKVQTVEEFTADMAAGGAP